MNCPECGQFMQRLIAFEVGMSPSVTGVAYYWWCGDPSERHTYDIDPIPAPEYNWIWFAEGIPQEALDEWPELAAEVAEMWERLPQSYKRGYLQ